MSAYLNSGLSIQARVADLLSRMTLPEKVGQLMQLSGQKDFRETIAKYQPGSMLHIIGDDLDQAITAASETRLKIPILFGEDAIHGHSFWPGATIFPTQLAMACSWNPHLIEQAARVTARELACTGPKWTFSPVLCLARDLRWGRIDETFGEDPFLIGEFATAMIRGYQGDALADPDAVLATAKHFAGYSDTQGGRDASEADISRRKLRSYFLPPFERAAREGCMTFMTGYQSMEGLPGTANRWLLTEVLKEEWGFKGILVTDWDNVGRMHHEQRICPTMKEAAALAIKSGNDLMMQTPDFFEGALDAVAEGLVSEAEIDSTCARILALKFRLGLFENPGRPDAERQREVIHCAAHKAVNLELARESLVLLKNSGILPLPQDGAKVIAVIGPNADDHVEQNGDWSLGSGQIEGEGHPRECTTTILDGIRAHVPKNWTVEFSRGCNVRDTDLTMLPATVASCERADYAVVVIGDQLPFVGEYKSTATLELQGGQLAMLEALAATGTPLIIVLISSKPLVLPESVRNAAAIFTAFNPGMEGGHALAEALWGKINPSGRLTISFPVHVGQQPVFYSQVRGQHGKRYADLTQEPLFPFGFGLSYTTFAYSDLEVLTPEIKRDETARFAVNVTNTGPRAGSEVVQLYIQDLFTSVTWVNKSLKAFQKLSLAPGESQRVELEVPASALWIVDSDSKYVIEPGEFEVQIGFSSRDADLIKGNFRVE